MVPRKRYIWIFIILLIFCLSPEIGAVIEFNESYTYNFWSEVVPGPEVYRYEGRITGEDLDVDEFNSPRDIYIQDEWLYVADTGNNRIVYFNLNESQGEVIDSFQKEGKEETFNNPMGIFVDEERTMYIADRDNNRIVILDQKGDYQREITSPEGETVAAYISEMDFQPEKVVVDAAGRVNVIGRGILEGLLQFDREGEFAGFIGAPEVRPDPTDYLWRSIMTESQRERMELFLPTQYSNIDTDSEGFIFATVAEGEIRSEEAIRKLTPSGTEILKRRGFSPPVGDIRFPRSELTGESSVTGPSRLTDVTSLENGSYTALDGKRGHVFTYDNQGNLLYTFGGLGNRKDKFSTPRGIDNTDLDLYILDGERGIKVFTPTPYTESIHQALADYDSGNYQSANQEWKEVLKYNPNLSLAYRHIGLSLLREENNELAMSNFRQANYRDGYSSAFERYRREYLQDKFGLIITVLLFLILGTFAVRYLLKKKMLAKQKEKWYFTIIKKGIEKIKEPVGHAFHPFGSSWNLKAGEKGSFLSATVIFILVVTSYILMRQYTGFLFNYSDLQRLNIIMEFLGILVPFILWCGVNWALTTLMEGKGTIKDIYITSAYGLMPIVLIYPPVTLISNFLTLDEGLFYHFFLVLGLAWALGLVFFGNLVIHQFTLGQTIFTTIITIIGIAVVLFLTLLFLNVIDQLYAFVYAIYTEISFIY
ncbi:MAG: YIP1 family protein [bacterium]